MATAAIGAVINVILNIVLIKTVGLHGAAIAAFVSFVIIFIIRAIDTKKIVMMDMKLPKMLVNTALLTAMGLAIIFVENKLYYYIILGVMFALIAGINFRSGLKAVKIILKKEKIEE